MKVFKLVVHQKNFSGEDLIINPKDYPGIQKGDVVEIYHTEDDSKRLLLQVTAFKEDFQTRDTISIEQTIASHFKLRTYGDVYINIVRPESVALDSLELTFKDQYMGRSEMWRLKNSLINVCVHSIKKIEFCGGSIRCQVNEMWSGGDLVGSGVINEDTKIVFRSQTSMVYLFLQMSSEMWEFDVHGDLYFEKAVNGFLTELFQKWKTQAAHEVTIVLFSRTFYEAVSLDEFPEYMRECLQQDYKGRFYEDFYRLAVQNERYDDWSSALVQLRALFRDYQQQVIEYHKRDGYVIPKAYNSTAAQGNFLEVLNMSLNVFEKHYLDRSFDRTGQLSVVITPGVGVFEVDRQVANITKQRIIDNGVGSDLVCVGEQPLHAVPLLKFQNKDSGDDYSMPHWINLSFYSSNKKIAHSNFIPRIKLPPRVDPPLRKPSRISPDPDEMLPNSVFDYDAYDAQVFQINTRKGRRNSKSNRQRRGERSKYTNKKGSVTLDGPDCSKLTRHVSDPDIHHTVTNAGGTCGGDPELPVPRRVTARRQASRALINPFDPSHVTIKLTSNRRRWTHIFPKGPTGVLIQQHHYQAVPSQPNRSDEKKNKNISAATKENKTLLWGATGEQEWTPALTTGVDWKSLTIPACLPITTDYFPDERSLQNDYLVSIYDLLPDDVNADYAQQRAVYKKPLSTRQVFRELVSQRLAQGFQLIVGVPGAKAKEDEETYLLSIGRIFHRISLTGSSISVTRYIPRHPYPPYNIQYRYRFQAPDHATYEMSWVSFTTEKLENYSWNFLDHYICTRGDTDFPLVENLKYWRFRMYVLPLSWCAAVTKRIMDTPHHCDGYTAPPPLADQLLLLESFLRFIELWINKLKRPNTYKKPRSPVWCSALNRRRHSTALVSNSTNIQSMTGQGSSPFRDRLGSFRMMDKPRPRSGSKVGERPPVENEAEDIIDFKLKSSSPVAEILEAMKHPTQGVGLFAAHLGLPSNTFSSADAVTWLVHHVAGITDGDGACAIMTTMIDDRLVCHASGEFSHPFIIGFYLYHICAQEKDTQDSEFCPPLKDLHSFRNEWLEVEVRHPYNWGKPSEPPLPTDTPPIPPFLAPVLEEQCQETNNSPRPWSNPLYRQVHLEMDVNGKSDRVEWGHCRYQSLFTPTRAYEIVVQWEATSGAIVADLICGWARKAQLAGMQMVPLPGDPLALPFISKSDPLRGPVFIPLDTDCLMDQGQFMFKDFAEDSWATRLILLQETIVQRFGFIPTVVEGRDTGKHHHHQYVHLTGNMFVLIPSQPCSRHGSVELQLPARPTRGRYPKQMEAAHSPHEEYITRHVNGHRAGQDGADTRPAGFLWFWNHMVSKRWRSSASPATGDENFQNKMLLDFRMFCSNSDGRLRKFWDQSRGSSASASAAPAQ